MPQNRVLNGRYHVGERIGCGGMADVYRGTDLRLDRTIAVKMMRRDLARDPRFQARFHQEARSAAALHHPNIVTVFDTGEQLLPDGFDHEVSCPFLVMEFISGSTVKDLLGEGEVKVSTALGWLDGLLTALGFAHSRGIAHRDIKPANIMVSDDGQVKVMDFGIARALTDTSASTTQTQAVVGTAQYLSPEQATGQEVDARSDLYSAGCVAFEMFTGRAPFVGDSPVAVAYQHVREQPPVPSTLNPQVSEALDAVVLTALAKDPADRFADAAQFARALAEAVAAPSQVPATATPPASDETLVPENIDDAASTAAAVRAAEQPTARLDVVRDEETDAHPTAPSVTATATGLAAVSADAPASAGDHRVDESGATSTHDPAAGSGPVDEPSSATASGSRRAGHTPRWPETPAPGPAAAPHDPRRRSGRRVTLPLVLALVALLLTAGALAATLIAQENSTTSVPQLTGMTREEAENALAAEGLRARVSEVYDPTVPAGETIDSAPAEQAEVAKDTEVLLHVSKGPASVTIPSSLKGMSESEARSELSKLGLSVTSVRTTDSGEVRKDRVVDTLPQADSDVAAGSAVELKLASGQAPVPNVVGLTKAEAKKSLEEELPHATVQFDRQKSKDAADGTVISQKPSGASTMDSDGTLTVVVAGEAKKDDKKKDEDSSSDGEKEKKKDDGKQDEKDGSAEKDEKKGSGASKD